MKYYAVCCCHIHCIPSDDSIAVNWAGQTPRKQDRIWSAGYSGDSQWWTTGHWRREKDMHYATRKLNSSSMKHVNKCESTQLGNTGSTILIGLYPDGCTWRTLSHSDCCYCAPICRVRTEGGNCQLRPICSGLSNCICGHICNIDTVVSDPPIPVLGRQGTPVERQWSRTSWKSCYILWSSSGC